MPAQCQRTPESRSQIGSRFGHHLKSGGVGEYPTAEADLGSALQKKDERTHSDQPVVDLCDCLAFGHALLRRAG